MSNQMKEERIMAGIRFGLGSFCLATFLLIAGCASTKSLLDDQVENGQLHFSTQNECFRASLNLMLRDLADISDKTLINTLTDLVRIQIVDTLDSATASLLETHITEKVGDGDDALTAGFLVKLLAFRIDEAKSVYARIPQKLKLSSVLDDAVRIYCYRSNTTPLRAHNPVSSNQSRVIQEYWPRTLAFNQIVHGRPSLQAILSMGNVTKEELSSVFPAISQNYDSLLYAYLLARPKTYPFSSGQQVDLLNNIDAAAESTSTKDGLLTVFLQSRPELQDTILSHLLSLICDNKLLSSATKLSSHITLRTKVSPDLLVRYGWLVSDIDVSLTENAWSIAKGLLDTSSYEYVCLEPYMAWLKGESSARNQLKELIKNYPKQVTPRRMYLEIALDAMNLQDLSAFLQNTKANLDSLDYNLFFRDYHNRVSAGIDVSLTVWENAVGTRYYVYRDESGTEWLYDRNLLALNMQRFVNTNGDYRLWFSQDGSQYLYDDSGSYQNVYRYLNSKGEFVYANYDKGRTYYYNDSLKWTGYYSYISKENKKIYVQTIDEVEYYYDSAFTYLNTYAFTNTNGERRYAVTDSFKTEYYDSSWQYLNKAKFSVAGYRDIYATCISSRLYLYYFDDSNTAIDLDICLMKSSSGQLIVEETRNSFKYYFDQFGNYLGYNVWQKGDEINAITLNNYSECKTYYKGFSEVSDNCSDDRPENIISRYPFLSRKLFELADGLVFGTVTTPLEAFRNIEEQIARRKAEEQRLAEEQRKREAWLAVANALNSFSESMSKSYSTYSSSSTYTPSYNTNYGTTTSSSYSYKPMQNSLTSTSSTSSYSYKAPTLPSYNRYSYENSPYNYENSPYNYNNSPYNYKNSQYNYKNSEYNYNNSAYNHKNSEYNYENSTYNYKNSPYNHKNSYFNPSRTEIVDSDGNSVGYAVPKKGGGYNLFDNDGNRTGYSTGEGRGLFSTEGKNQGYIVPKKKGGANIFFTDE